MASKEQKRESFKKALLHATRALSSHADADIAFGGEHATVQQKSARIPLPARQLDRKAASIARGEGDAAALRLAHHNAQAHALNAPKGAKARAVFTALEYARCEAIGAAAMKGVGDNLDASLEKQITDKGYDRLGTNEAPPIGEIAALLLRERITGRPSPTSAAKILEPHRAEIETAAGDALDKLAGTPDLFDQDAFAQLARALIDDLNLDDDDRGDQEKEEDDHEEDSDDKNEDQQQDDESAEDQSAEDYGDADSDDSEPEHADQDLDDNFDDEGASENANATALQPDFNGDTGADYDVYTTEFDEIADALDFCDAEELARLRRSLDRQVENFHSVVARLATKLQRKLLAQQNRSWSFDLDEGVWMRPVWHALWLIRCNRFRLKWNANMSSAIRS